VSRSTDQRIADILQAIDRCQLYADALVGDDKDNVNTGPAM